METLQRQQRSTSFSGHAGSSNVICIRRRWPLVASTFLSVVRFLCNGALHAADGPAAAAATARRARGLEFNYRGNYDDKSKEQIPDIEAYLVPLTEKGTERLDFHMVRALPISLASLTSIDLIIQACGLQRDHGSYWREIERRGENPNKITRKSHPDGDRAAGS
ncbi:hypothetical protein EVAR_35401_1 [Eumeta japonica]|uniref:Uncharacterized protein n=1 Tax=Eumeta variegata TaxID=151549 RepID=A0A4C1XCC4_EUMVA|nr:hypothetical protein EVAR_35401_1 [Eumeta japonica]